MNIVCEYFFIFYEFVYFFIMIFLDTIDDEWKLSNTSKYNICMCHHSFGVACNGRFIFKTLPITDKQIGTSGMLSAFIAGANNVSKNEYNIYEKAENVCTNGDRLYGDLFRRVNEYFFGECVNASKRFGRKFIRYESDTSILTHFRGNDEKLIDHTHIQLLGIFRIPDVLKKLISPKIIPFSQRSQYLTTQQIQLLNISESTTWNALYVCLFILLFYQSISFLR